MESTKKKRHTDAELIEIFHQKSIPEKYHSRFITEYDSTFNEFYEEAKDWPDEDYEEDESVQGDALKVTFMYIEPFMQQIEIGHSEQWAEIMAKYHEEDEYVAFHYAYTGIYEKNQEQAKEELLIHCKYLNTDEHFIRYFLYLFNIGEGYSEPIEKAKVYSEMYNKQINLGKSVVFAHEYADLMAWDNVKSYCEAYATAYDDSLQAGRSEDYARRYAEMYGDFVTDNYSKFSDVLKHRDFVLGHEMIIGNMKGWEYACENNMVELDLFVSIYEKTHMNTYFDDDCFLKNIEGIDKIVLTVALEEYNKRMKK